MPAFRLSVTDKSMFAHTINLSILKVFKPCLCLSLLCIVLTEVFIKSFEAQLKYLSCFDLIMVNTCFILLQVDL